MNNSSIINKFLPIEGLLAILFLVFFSNGAFAQLCAGTLGEPITGAGTDFGRGSNPFGIPLGTATTYNFIAGTPNDGSYTIVKSTANLNPGWHQNVINHTANDPDGYMMVVNASNTSGIFYQTTVNGLCGGITYEFASYVINILRNPGIRPNILFTIESNGVTLASISTGDIPEGLATDWIKYGTQFKTPINVGTVTLTMSNRNPGGIGNHLAIDDITFRACGPKITPVILSTSTNTANLCEGESAEIELSAAVSAGFTNPVYQWQGNNGSGWFDLSEPGAQTTQVKISFINAISGTYNYQLLVAEQGNLNSPNCRIASTPLIINVNANPKALITFNGSNCEGGTFQLNASGGTSYSWTGPNNFKSSQQNPVLSQISSRESGVYQVTVTNSNGCSASSSIIVKTISKPLININIAGGETTICAGEKIQLIAEGGASYRWQPTTGLSNPNVANPIASPDVTTQYTIFVSENGCEASKDILIKVIPKATVDAGEDKKILNGQSVELKPAISGENLQYEWTPANYLDDPKKLNPIANPPSNITYTLHVTSSCGVVSDEVNIQVYPKIEIPNSFSPNGDGKNDTWNIPALQAFPSHRINIRNRAGQLVYTGKGDYKAWDGKFNGKNVPAGTYYYSIYLNEDFDTQSGWVFVLR